MHAHEMISTHPHVKGNTNDALIRCIEECLDCAQVCTSCADACLGENMVAQLTQCIRLNMDCADICMATGSVARRRTGSNEDVIRHMLNACMTEELDALYPGYGLWTASMFALAIAVRRHPPG